MTIDEMIAVLQAAKAGKPIQQQYLRKNVWDVCDGRWDFTNYRYRVKPEPRRWWLNVYPSRIIASAWMSPQDADENASPNRRECVEVVEVRHDQSGS
jgi:hypothetical protein